MPISRQKAKLAIELVTHDNFAKIDRDFQNNARTQARFQTRISRTVTAPSSSRRSPLGLGSSSESLQELARQQQNVQNLKESLRQAKQQKRNQMAINVEKFKASMAMEIGTEASDDLDQQLRVLRANFENGGPSQLNGSHGTTQSSVTEELPKKEDHLISTVSEA